jgi:uncharacterized membrane protein YhaH (DUF805 family)
MVTYMSEFQNFPSSEGIPAFNGDAGGQPTGGNPENLDLPLYGASIGQAVTRFFKRYVRFDGRSSRSEYWWVTLALTVVFGVLYALTYGTATYETVQTVNGATRVAHFSPVGVTASVISAVLGLATILPSIAVTVRRLHDGGFSGWLYLLNLVPFLGSLVVLILTIMPSKPEGRRFDRPGVQGGAAPTL